LRVLRDRLDGEGTRRALQLEDEPYLLVTLHRPALVDGPLLAEAIGHLAEVSRTLPVIFPAHPRTQARMRASGIRIDESQMHVIDPLGYLEFMGLVAGAAGVLTDSGGVQEETTVLKVPCFTLRDNTERPVTVEQGTNTLLGLDPARIADVPRLLSQPQRPATIPSGWDGHAAERLVDVLEQMVPAGSSA
jgi:UDP-N-acetylglucosamine 2-epimerase (non-hydrolysing)